MDIIPISPEILGVWDEPHAMSDEDIEIGWAVPSLKEFFFF